MAFLKRYKEREMYGDNADNKAADNEAADG